MVRHDRSELDFNFPIAPPQHAALTAADFEFLAINSYRFARFTIRTAGLVQKLTGSAVTFGQANIDFLWGDLDHRHAERHPRRFVREVRAGLYFIENDDIAGSLNGHNT